jgi:hypothetical protein
MARPSTGLGGSEWVAGPRDSRDEGDGGRCIRAAVLVSARKNIDRGPID